MKLRILFFVLFFANAIFTTSNAAADDVKANIKNFVKSALATSYEDLENHPGDVGMQVWWSALPGFKGDHPFIGHGATAEEAQRIAISICIKWQCSTGVVQQAAQQNLALLKTYPYAKLVDEFESKGLGQVISVDPNLTDEENRQKTLAALERNGAQITCAEDRFENFQLSVFFNCSSGYVLVP